MIQPVVDDEAREDNRSNLVKKLFYQDSQSNLRK